jgi:hypothetical protein
VPVRYFEGTVREAQDEALRLNIKDKLPMSRAEKFEAAWRLVQRGEKIQEEIADLTAVSLRTIATMAKVLRDKPEAAKYPWRRARAYEFGSDTMETNNRDWWEEKAQKLAKQLVKNVGVGFVRDTDITARALEIVNDELPRALIYEWLDTAKEVLVDVVREDNNTLADSLLTAFLYGDAPGTPSDGDNL